VAYATLVLTRVVLRVVAVVHIYCVHVALLYFWAITQLARAFFLTFRCVKATKRQRSMPPLGSGSQHLKSLWPFGLTRDSFTTYRGLVIYKTPITLAASATIPPTFIAVVVKSPALVRTFSKTFSVPFSGVVVPFIIC